MPKKAKKDSIPGRKSSLRFNLLKNRKSKDDWYPVKMRIRYRLFEQSNQVYVIDSPVRLYGEQLKLRDGDLENNTVHFGKERHELNKLNIDLRELAQKCLRIVDSTSKKLTQHEFHAQLKEANKVFKYEITPPVQQNATALSIFITKPSPELLFNSDKFDRTNIFMAFASLKYDKKVPATYKKIIIRLFEFREHVHPSEHIQQLDSKWLTDFFHWLKATGWYHINTSKFNPLDYNKKMFFKDIDRAEYKPKSLNKMISMTKSLISSDEEYSLKSKKMVGTLNLKSLKLSRISEHEDKSGTRLEHNLKLSEMRELVTYEFNAQCEEQYQKKFDKANGSKGVKITYQDLSIARDLFILQVFFGGLRGYKELASAQLLKHSKTEWKVKFFQNKVSNTIVNPLNAFTEFILKKHDNKIPRLHRTNGHNRSLVQSVDMLEEHYRSLLRTIAEILEFDRDVIVDNINNEHKPIKEIFGPYFARKTFGTILYQDLRLRVEEIAVFTGHKLRKQSELIASYIEMNNYERKKELLKNLSI